MDFTDELRSARDGDGIAADRLLPQVYDELRRLAAAYLRAERQGHTLQPTALVHEAYLRLVDQTRAGIADRDHFLALAAQAMRRILVDHARAKRSAKRTPEAGAVEREAELPASGADVLAIDDALTRLAARGQRLVRVVELRYFAGLSVDEAARVLGVSTRTVKDDWRFASAFLRREWSRAEHPP